MKLLEWLQQFTTERLEVLHLRLAGREAQVQLALLGMLSGVVTGVAMVAFDLVIRIPQTAFLGTENPENYESLSLLWRLLLPTLGGLLVGLLFQRLTAADSAVGVVHVMERMAYGEGHLPIKNAGVQFVSAALCILCGHSVGREGPAVHIGAACASWMGQKLRLPNNSIRVLVGCGTAGAIAAAFNTPLAGVIFAMEVMLVEYTLASFTPIILAAVSATMVSRWALGSEPVITVSAFSLGSLGDLLYVVLMGIGIGVLSTLFVHLLVFFSNRFTARPVWLRMTLAGVLTGIIALFVPEIMSLGYDTSNAVLLGKLGLGMMLIILLGKLLATSLGLGLGLPGGLIGPTLAMGVLAGGVTGAILDLLIPGHASSPALYAMLGMGAMMGATLNAPLAALTALLELTINPYIILPGMLAIIAAELTSHQGFGAPSVFLKMMEVRGLHYHSDPISQFLRRLGVTHAMDRQVIRLPRLVEQGQLANALLAQPHWVAVEDDDLYIVAGDALQQHQEAEEAKEAEAEAKEEWVDLGELSIRRVKVAPIPAQATLEGALRKMDQEKVDALWVRPHQGERILGIITREHIERSYRLPLN